MVLASSRDYSQATVLILQPVLDATSGRMRTEEKAYRYQRRDAEARP